MMGISLHLCKVRSDQWPQFPPIYITERVGGILESLVLATEVNTGNLTLFSVICVHD